MSAVILNFHTIFILTLASHPIHCYRVYRFRRRHRLVLELAQTWNSCVLPSWFDVLSDWDVFTISELFSQHAIWLNGEIFTTSIFYCMDLCRETNFMFLTLASTCFFFSQSVWWENGYVLLVVSCKLQNPLIILLSGASSFSRPICSFVLSRNPEPVTS